MMEAKDVLSLPWTKIDWQDLHSCNGFLGEYVEVSHIHTFVESVYHEVSRKLNIPYKELYPILKSENEPFYRSLRNWEDDEALYCEEGTFPHLKEIFRVPNVNFDKVTTCVELFEKLSDVEKVQFLQKIGKISVTVQTQ